MIYGIGIDTVLISRIEKSLKNENFINRVYGKEEILFLSDKKNKSKSAAANFAAKEAFGKALKTGICSGDFKLFDVQILRDKNGAPYFNFTNEALNIMQKNSLCAHISLTHEADIASAFVILEKM